MSHTLNLNYAKMWDQKSSKIIEYEYLIPSCLLSGNPHPAQRTKKATTQSIADTWVAMGWIRGKAPIPRTGPLEMLMGPIMEMIGPDGWEEKKKP